MPVMCIVICIKLHVMFIVIYMCFGTIYEKKNRKNSQNKVNLPVLLP